MRLIDADALSNKLGEWWNIPKDWDGGMAQACEDAFTAIDDAPTIDAQPVKHGQWIFSMTGSCACSECGEVFHYEIGNYCSNCGAKMDGGYE